MKNTYIIFFALLMHCSLNAKLACADVKEDAVVTVKVSDQQLRFKSLPRLVDVLQPVALQNDWYWPASGLYRLDPEQPERLRQQILARLTQLKGKWPRHSQHVDTITQLSFQLQQWRLAERVNIDIDYDLARLQESANPQLEAGHYELILTARPRFVFVSGLARSEPIIHHGNTSVGSYTRHLRLLPGASREWLFVLQADGVVLRVGIANRNQQYQELMPGSLLFVPFDTDFFGEEFSEINQSIIELAKHRVLL